VVNSLSASPGNADLSRPAPVFCAEGRPLIHPGRDANDAAQSGFAERLGHEAVPTPLPWPAPAVARGPGEYRRELDAGDQEARDSGTARSS
jgi:hypothetical protein